MSSDLIHECDRAANRFVWFGDIDRILGYPAGEFPRTFEAWEQAIHPEDHARVMTAVTRHWDSGEHFFQEYRVLRKDGSLLHWNHSGTMLRGADGRPTRCIGTVTDISRRRQIEEALRLSEKRYRTLFERNLAGVYRSTLDGRILDCNESFARIFGYGSREEVLQQAAWDLYLKPEDREAAVAKLLERQNLTNYEICLKRKDGSSVWVLESENLIEGPDGRLSVIEGTAIDITERKRAEEQVKHLAFHDPLTEPAEPAPLQRPADAGRRPGAPRTTSGWPSCSSTSIASRSSTTRSATPSATSCCGRSPSASRSTSARATRSRGWAATSSRCSSRGSRPKRTRPRSRARSATPCTTRSGSTAASSSSRRASASASTPPTGTTPRRSCATPTPPCTAPRSRAATTTSSTRPR